MAKATQVSGQVGVTWRNSSPKKTMAESGGQNGVGETKSVHVGTILKRLNLFSEI